MLSKERRREIAKIKENKKVQVTKWLKTEDLEWLESESERLTAKGWEVKIIRDQRGRRSLWHYPLWDKE